MKIHVRATTAEPPTARELQMVSAILATHGEVIVVREMMERLIDKAFQRDPPVAPATPQEALARRNALLLERTRDLFPGWEITFSAESTD